MTVLYEKLHGSNGALESLSQLDTDITKALKTYGPPPDRSLPATFQTLARSIVGQQISGAAASSVWNRMKEAKLATEDVISNLEPDDMMPLGLSRRKAEYIIGIAKEITSGDLVLESLPEMSGDEVLMAMQYSRRHSSLNSPFQDGETSSLMDIIEDSEAEEPEAKIMMESMSEEVNGALETLSERERVVLEMYFGINRDSAMTLNEIGEEFDLTRERVRQIKEKAIQRLRHRSRSKNLRRYLG